jgi:hypothetical protein
MTNCTLSLIIGIALVAFAPYVPARAATAQSKTVTTSTVSEWPLFTSEEGGFSAKMPGSPRKLDKKMAVFGVTIDLHGFACIYNGHDVVLVAFGEMPAFNGQKQILKAIAATTESATVSDGGKVISSGAIQQAGCDAWDIVGRGPAARFRQSRFFLSGGRLYIAAYSTESESGPTSKAANEFLDSFQVVGGCKPTVAAPVVEEAPPLSGPTDPVYGWQKISVERDGFTILAPSSVTVKETRVGAEPNLLVRRSYTARSKDCVVSVTTVSGSTQPEPDAVNVSPDTFMERAATSALEEMKAAGIDADFTGLAHVGDLRARDYLLTVKGHTGRAWICGTRSRLFIFAVVCQKSVDCKRDIDTFFGSVQITGR